MIRPQVVQASLGKIGTINKITDVFSSIASIQISKTKQKAQASTEFFNLLWDMYTKLRVDEEDGFTQSRTLATTKELYLVVTAEGGFSGDIDQKLIEWMLTQYDPEKADIVVIGHHGVIQLAQRGVSIKQYFKLPSDDENIDVSDMLAVIQQYPTATAFYQTYISLSVQDVKRLSLQSAVKKLGEDSETTDEIITNTTYIFEPDSLEVIRYLEGVMLGVALSQVILESKLAQYASRFRAMSSAHDKSQEMHDELTTLYNRAKRSVADERIKEIINGLRASRGRA